MSILESVEWHEESFFFFFFLIFVKRVVLCEKLAGDWMLTLQG